MGVTAIMQAPDSKDVGQAGFVTPWASTGHQFLTEPPTAEEAMRLAEQDWEVLERPLFTTNAKGHRTPAIPGYKATVRSDNEAILGIVKSGYKPTQNRLLYDFEKALTDDSGLRYISAGCLSGGKTVWAQAEVPKHIRIKGDDSDIIPYLIAWTGHDGNRGFGVGATTVRVRCQNTFHGATTQKDMPRLTLRHTASVEDRIGEARQALQMTFAYTETIEQVLNDLAARDMTKADFEAFTEKFLPVAEGAKNPYRTLRDREVLQTLYSADTATLDGLKFTNYRALQAVTEFVDHHRAYQQSDGNTAADNRALSLLDGQGARMKQRALDLLTV